MALTQRGSATATSFTTGATSWNSCTYPSGVSQGDLLLAIFCTATTHTISSLSGWNQIGTTQAVGTDSSGTLAWRIAGSSETSWSFSSLFTANQQGHCVIIAWSAGFAASNPIHKVAQTASGTVTSVSGPSVTPTHDNTTILQIIGTDPGTGTYAGTPDTSPVGTELYDAKTSSGSYSYIYVQKYDQSTAAALALDVTGLTSDAYWCFQLSITQIADLVPTGITSEEAFGSHSVIRMLQEITSAGAIASAEAFGTAEVATVALTYSRITQVVLEVPEYSAPTTPTLYPSGIASLEAFGTTVFTTGAVTITVSAIGSAEAFGTDLITVNISPSSITTLEAFGDHTVAPGAVTLSPSGIDSLEAFGAHTITTGAVTISPSAIGSLEAFGDHTVAIGAVNLYPSAIDSLEAFGTAVITTGAVTVAPSSIGSEEAFGAHTLAIGAVTIYPASIDSLESVGSHVVAPQAVTISPSSITTLEAFGTHAVTATQSISVSSIASLEAFGSHTISVGAVTILPSSITSEEAFGSTSVTQIGVTQTIYPSSIASTEAFGATVITTGAVSISVSSITSLEAFGSVAVSVGAVTIAPAGISSLEAFGSHALSLWVTPSGILTSEAFGAHTLQAIYGISVESIASLEAFGATTVLGGLFLPASDRHTFTFTTRDRVIEFKDDREWLFLPWQNINDFEE